MLQCTWNTRNNEVETIVERNTRQIWYKVTMSLASQPVASGKVSRLGALRDLDTSYRVMNCKLTRYQDKGADWKIESMTCNSNIKHWLDYIKLKTGTQFQKFKRNFCSKLLLLVKNDRPIPEHPEATLQSSLVKSRRTLFDCKIQSNTKHEWSFFGPVERRWAVRCFGQQTLRLVAKNKALWKMHWWRVS